jgi:6-phosphogluconate dehydrogenase
MAEKSREFGVVGLGQMGGNLARQALEKAFRVVGLLHRDPHEDIVQMGMEPIRPERPGEKSSQREGG